jgi:hypothetical protein
MKYEDYNCDLGHRIEPENEKDLSDGGRLCGNGGAIRYRQLFNVDFHALTLNEYPLFKTREDKLSKFQIITLKECDLQSFVNKSFDFDVCKNTFQYVKVSDDMKKVRPKMKLRLSKPLEILERNAIFKSTRDVRISLARCNKYMNRGFKFVGHPSLKSKVRERFNELIAERNGCDLDSK